MCPFNFIFQSATAVYAVLASVLTTVVYFFGKSQGKSKAKTEQLEKELHHVTDVSKTVSAIQQAQAHIASALTNLLKSNHE
jgi:hypothetical protein